MLEYILAMVRTPPATQQAYPPQQQAGATKLKATIPFGILLMLGINAIIGTGIFFVPSIAAGIAGPNSLISWILVAIIALVIAACFAELSAMYPKCGGVYEYTKAGFGQFAGFLVGWTSWIVANVTIAMLAIGAWDYLGIFMQFTILHKILLAIAFVVLMNYVSFRGIDVSVKVLLVFAICTILSLWTLFTWGIYYVSYENLMPLTIFPKVSILIAMLYILETFFGWETVTYMSEETKDPQKTIPKVMMWATLAVTLLAVGVVTVVLGAVPWERIAASTAPLVDAAVLFMGEAGAKGIAILVFLNIIGGAAAWIVVTPRLVYALARDNLLPAFLSKIHQKRQTPYMAILMQTIITIVILLSGSYKTLLEMLLPLAIFMYAMVIVSVSILRFTQPTIERGFKVPFGKFLPIIIALILLFLAGGIEWHTIMFGLMFILLGIPLYLLQAMIYNPDVAKKMLNFSTGIGVKTSNIWLKKKTKKHIFTHLGNIKNKVILHFGTDASVFAVELSKYVEPRGKLHVTHIAKGHLKAIKKLADKQGLKNIEYTLENAEERHKMHHHLRNLDGAVAAGVLGYLKEPDKVLAELNRRLKPGAKIYFIDYDKVLFLPEQKWMESPDTIKQTLRKAGFDVKVAKERGLLWRVLHIYGKKVR